MNYDLSFQSVCSFSPRIKNVPRSGVREILKATDKSIISFGGGIPHESCIPADVISGSFERVLSKYGNLAFSYGQTEGEPLLREFVADVWMKRLGISADPSDILIVNGSQQALDLLGKVFFDKETKVLVERPTYMAALQAWSLYQPEFLEANLDQMGVNPDQMEMQLKKHRCRFFYCIPSFQNPSGICYSKERRLAVVNVLNKYGALLIEDDPYSDLFYEQAPPPPVSSMGVDNAVYLSTFSKTVAPGFRLGWIYAKPDIMRHLVTAKQAADLCTGRFIQLLLYETLCNLDLDNHLDNLRKFSKTQRDTFDTFMKKHLSGLLNWEKPSGGMFFWASTMSIEASELLSSCIRNGVAFADGATFHAEGGGKNFFRLNFTQVLDQAMDKGLSVIKEQIKKRI